MMDVCKFKPGDLVRLAPVVNSKTGWTEVETGWQARPGLVLCAFDGYKDVEPDDLPVVRRRWWRVSFAGTIRVISEGGLEKIQ